METVIVRNIAPGNTQVTIHGNSGKTWHLPPMYSAEIPENEIIGNKMVGMLIKKKHLLLPEKSGKTKKKTTKSARSLKNKGSRSSKSKTRARAKVASKKAKK
jgi:hypothetical protein